MQSHVKTKKFKLNKEKYELRSRVPPLITEHIETNKTKENKAKQMKNHETGAALSI